jgi:tRNA pseudouridine65 synthase
MHVEPLYRDEHLVAVNKPSGLAVHRGWATDRVTALSLARDTSGRHVYPVHRLDRGTSGVLVFAFDGATAALLQERFKERAVLKRYLALTRGITPESGRIDHPVPRSEDGERVPAVTSYRRLGVALDRYSLIEAIPETGRLHQIRRHLKHLHHPLIGDTKYGDGRENRRWRELGLTRLALHAAELRFPHPVTSIELAILAPFPDDLRVPLERAGLSLDGRDR